VIFMDVKGKVAIVTGASRGIGLATAKLLATKGAKVALVARSKNKLDQLALELPDAFAFEADLSNVQEAARMVQATLKHYGRVDVLINNAGQGYDAPVEKTDATIFQCLFNLDVLAPVVAMKEAIPIMRKQGGGAIVNISSGLALMQLPDMGAYSALKAALRQISLTAREELKDDKIAVTAIYPYITATNFEKNTIKDSSVAEEEETFEGQQAWAKADSAEYVAQLIVDAVGSGEAEVFAHDWMKPKQPE
jgi:short-subunit dehydrogenase